MLLALPPRDRPPSPRAAVDGGLNVISIYMGVITIRILLSWFPQAQGVAALAPLFTVSDAYLNLFRGVVPPIGGINISPIGAFFVLNLLSSGVASLAAPMRGAPDKQPAARPRMPGARIVDNFRARLVAA